MEKGDFVIYRGTEKYFCTLVPGELCSIVDTVNVSNLPCYIVTPVTRRGSTQCIQISDAEEATKQGGVNFEGKSN